jgi:PKD repeat protein
VFFSCARAADGSVSCWGLNDHGQLAVPAGVYSQVSAGGAHACAVKSDGGLACWGKNDAGQAVPPSGSFIGVRSGGNHSCALRSDRQVACWGLNIGGQATPPAGAFSDVAPGDDHTCGVRIDGTLACWGSATDGKTSAPAGLFTKLGAGQFHTCAIRSDGALACWGKASFGETTPPGGRFRSVDGGTQNGCGVRSDGSVACWGSNSFNKSVVPADFATPDPAAPGACVGAPAGLVSWWRGEGNGDDAAGENPGTPMNGLGFAGGLVGQAFRYDGLDDGLRVGTRATLDVGLGDGFTMEGWIFPTGNTGSLPFAFGAGPIVEYANGLHLHQHPALASLFANVFDAAGREVYLQGSGVVQTAWNHVALTYSKGNGVGTLYVNGAVSAARSLGSYTARTSTDLYVGLRPAGTFGAPATGVSFSGLIDEMSVYNRSLTAAEIARIASADWAGKCVNHAPEAAAGGPYTGTEGAAIRFDGTGSSDADGDALTFAWDFGDGATASSTSPDHAYADDGTYPVTLVVTDARGRAGTPVTTTATVSNVSPQVQATLPATAVSGELVALDASFADPGALDGPWQGRIEWSDFTFLTLGLTAPGPFPASHRFFEPRTHTISVAVTDTDGATGRVEASIVVERLPVVIDVLPGTNPNVIRLRKTDNIAVAVLSTPTFAAVNLYPFAITLGDGTAPETTAWKTLQDRDVNRDGLRDLVFQFQAAPMVAAGDLSLSTTQLVLLGVHPDGRYISGTDEVRVSP